MTTMTHRVLVLGFLLAACGDPKGAAGAAGLPAQKMDPSKMDRAVEQKGNVEQKVTPTTLQIDQKAVQRLGDGSVRPAEQKGADGSVVPAPQQ